MSRKNRNHINYLKQLKKCTQIYDRHNITQGLSIACCWTAIFNLLYSTQPLVAGIIAGSAFLIHGFIQRIDILFSRALEKSLTQIDDHEARQANRSQTALLVAEDIKKLAQDKVENEAFHSELDSAIITTDYVNSALATCEQDEEATMKLQSTISIVEYPLVEESFKKANIIEQQSVFGGPGSGNKQAWVARFGNGSDGGGAWKQEDRSRIVDLINGKQVDDHHERFDDNTYNGTHLSFFQALRMSLNNEDTDPHRYSQVPQIQASM